MAISYDFVWDIYKNVRLAQKMFRFLRLSEGPRF